MGGFHALVEGVVDDDGDLHTLTVRDLGVLKVPSGRVEASDPFVTLGSGVVVDVPPGDYPVRVTIADVSDAQDGSHLREAYLSLILAGGEAASVEPASDQGVMVDAGTVAFADAAAIERCMPASEDWYEELFDDDTDESWFSRMDDPAHLGPGFANIVMPLATAGENVVLSHSGWGDGIYPVARTLDAAGNAIGLHIDLLVVGDAAYMDDVEPPPPPPEPAPAKPGRLRRLLGR
ncbi:MAG TPA: DUF4241 domain-containing protein [Acidimicrobiales bacterium]